MIANMMGRMIQVTALTYIDTRRLPLNHRGLKKDVLIDEPKIVMQFCNRPGEDSLTGCLLLLSLLLLLLLLWWWLLLLWRGCLLNHYLRLRLLLWNKRAAWKASGSQSTRINALNKEFHAFDANGLKIRK